MTAGNIYRSSIVVEPSELKLPIDLHQRTDENAKSSTQFNNSAFTLKNIQQHEVLASITLLIYRYTSQKTFNFQYFSISGQTDIQQTIEINVDDQDTTLKELTQQAFDYFDNKIIASKPQNDKYIPDLDSIEEKYKDWISTSTHKLNWISIDLDEAKNISAEELTKKLFKPNVNSSSSSVINIISIFSQTNQSINLITDNTKLSQQTTQTLPTHFELILNEINKEKDYTLDSLPIVSKDEIEQQHNNCKSEPIPFPEQLIYQTIEGIAASKPHATALEFGEQTIDYQTLNSRSNQLANFLISQGVSKQTPIVVLTEPAPEIIVSLVAIHKIGCIYVPLDPNFPKARIQVILDEVAPGAILANGSDIHIPDDYQAITINLDHGQSDAIAQQDTSSPAIDVSLEDISHIFFTSGTTGKPKGIMATQQNLIHYLHSAKAAYGFSEKDNFISTARFTFSISFFELLSPLILGGTLRILPRDEILNFNLLTKHFEWATVFHIGPSLLRNVLPYIKDNYDDFSAFEHMRHVSSGGDMVPPDILEQLKTIFKHAEVFVIYGSSEVSCMGCRYFVPRDKTITRTFVGKPHNNVEVRIENDAGLPVPAGVTGNILFGGNGLVDGYLNLDDLTREKFITRDNKRFYSMGDIGRFDEQGNLEMLGRRDFQVQIKGMRIELAEIEACLRQFDDVKDIVVTAHQFEGELEKSLIAYLVAKDNQTIDLAELLEHSKNFLADYMLPRHYIKLDALPTNHNGKLDRKALPTPSAENILTNDTIVEASNEIETNLLNIWKTLFKRDDIGVRHDFFDLGGDSILAVNFLMEVENQYEKLIPITAMLASPTIEKIATIIESEDGPAGLGDVAILKHGSAKPPIYCLYGVLIYKELAETLDTDRPVCGVYIEEEVSLMRTEDQASAMEMFSSVEKISERYVKSIRAFQPNGPYYLCGLSFGGIISLEVGRLLIEAGEEVNLIGILDGRAPDFLSKLTKSQKLLLHLKLLKKEGLSYPLKKITPKINSLFNKKKTSSDENNDVPDPTDLVDDNDLRSRARHLASSNYNPAPFNHREVLLFTAEERDEFEIESEDLGWSEIIPQLQIYSVPGDHLGILKKGNVEILAKYMSNHID